MALDRSRATLFSQVKILAPFLVRFTTRQIATLTYHFNIIEFKFITQAQKGFGTVFANS